MIKKEYEDTLRRICRYYENCDDGCPFNEDVKYCGTVTEKAYDIVQAVEKWGKEHPIQTNRDKIEEIFGFKEVETLHRYNKKTLENEYVITTKWLEQEYQEPKGAEQ